MKLKKVLVTTPTHFIPKARVYMEGRFCCVFSDQSREEVKRKICRVDAWICHPCPEYKIDESLLKHANNLKIIASTSTGTNHIDVEHCKTNGIKVLCLKGNPRVGTIVASSEFTFGLVLAVTRNLPGAFDSAKSGKWRDVEDDFRGIELCGKTMGIIGFGRIGSNNARYANAFGMKVVAYDPFVGIGAGYVEQKSTYEEVLSQADVLMVCVHLNQRTKNMVNAAWFDEMKDGVFFINTSRGEIVDENALLAALKSGKVKAAGLDVIANESDMNKQDREIIKYANENSNLIITPHIAGLTYDSEEKAAMIMTDAVFDCL